MPTTYRVIVTPAALEDLDGLTEYIKRDSPQNALRVFNRLWQACQSLSTFPYRFAIRQNRRDASKTVRAIPVRPFIIYYRVDEKLRVVRVLTMRHGHQRQPRRFT